MRFTLQQFEEMKRIYPLLYHRTFESDRDISIRPDEAQMTSQFSDQIDRQLNGSRPASMGSTPGWESRRMLRDAFFTDGARLFPTRIWQREGQNFELYATPWEKWWSTLFRSRHDCFKPIVNEFNILVGHYGRVTSEKILSNQLPPDHTSNDFTSLYLSYDLVIGNSAEASAGYRRALFTFAYYGIQTGVDGDIVAGYYDGPTNNGQAIPDDVSPIDLAAAFQILFSASTVIWKVGSNKLMTIARRKLAKRPEVVPLTRSASKTLPGVAVSTRGMLPMETMGRRTIIMGDDMPTFKHWLSTNRPVSGMYDIVIHGDTKNFFVLEKGVWKEVSARDVANAVRNQLGPGDQIRLLACETGTHGGPAQQLANELQRTVWAPSKMVYPVQGVVVKDASGKAVRVSNTKSFVPADNGKFFAFSPVTKITR